MMSGMFGNIPLSKRNLWIPWTPTSFRQYARFPRWTEIWIWDGRELLLVPLITETTSPMTNSSHASPPSPLESPSGLELYFDRRDLVADEDVVQLMTHGDGDVNVYRLEVELHPPEVVEGEGRVEEGSEGHVVEFLVGRLAGVGDVELDDGLVPRADS